MSIPFTNGPLVDLQPTYGAIFIGVAFSTGLLGIATLQVWRYYNNFPKDPIYLKAIVAYVWIVEFLRTAFSVHGVYYYLVLEWGNPLALANLVWDSQITLLMSTLVEIAVRLYFAYRVWIMSRKNWFITSFIVLLALGHLAIGIGTWIFSLQDTRVADHTTLLHSFGTAGLALSVAADWTISLSLIFFLLKNRGGMAGTNSIINRIIAYTINMGVITSFTDIVILGLSLWNSRAPQLYFLAVFQVVGNLYANSLLASLNSRIEIREREDELVVADFSAFAASSRPQENHDSTLAGSQRSRNGEPESYSNKDLSTINLKEKYPTYSV